MPIVSSSEPYLIDHWQRLQMQVRCGLRAGQPESVWLYLSAGATLARQGMRPPIAVNLRMLHNLLLTAQDEALSWYWRSVCLEHISVPIAQLRALVGLHDPIAMQAIEAASERARSELSRAAVARHRAA